MMVSWKFFNLHGNNFQSIILPFPTQFILIVGAEVVLIEEKKKKKKELEGI